LHVSIAYSIRTHHQQIALRSVPVKEFVPESDSRGFAEVTSVDCTLYDDKIWRQRSDRAKRFSTDVGNWRAKANEIGVAS
jgi:hypothetical protein